MTVSIRQRLLISLLLSTIVAWGGVATVSYLDSLKEIEEVFDAQLAQSAKAVLLLSRHELYEQLAYDASSRDNRTVADPSELKAGIHKYEHAVAMQIWVGTNMLAYRSSSAPEEPFAEKMETFSERTINDFRWRIYAVRDEESNIAVHVAEKLVARDELARSISLRLFFGITLALPALMVLILVSVRHALRPLQRIADAVKARSVNRLSPVATDHVPSEAMPLVTAINALFSRLQDSIENERRFTADASHELRTPLAALKTHAQLAMRAPNLDTATQDTLQRVIDGVDRATRMVEQLLVLARIDPQASQSAAVQFDRVELCDLARNTLADMAPQAIKQKIELGLNETGCGIVSANNGMLEILLRNLVGNAIRYTPPQGHVEITIQTTPTSVRLMVDDSGPGIPPSEREKVFQRFYRCPGTKQTGSGLGLSIVKRIVELHDGQVTLGDSPLGGLQVTVVLPAFAAVSAHCATPKS